MKNLVLIAALLATGNASAAVVTQWNFNSTTADANTATGSLNPSTGSGVLSLLGGVTQTFAGVSGTGASRDPADDADDSGLQTTGYKAPGVGDKTAGVQFKLSTVGMQNISISYDLRHSNTSSRYEQFQYSLDGNTFVDYVTFDGSAGDTWFNRNIDLSSIAAASNNANFAFRIVSTFAPNTSAYAASKSGSTYAGTGTWRFDYVTVNGIAAVPEAETSAMLLAGLGLMGFMARRRK